MKDRLKISLTFSRYHWLKTFPVVALCLVIDSQQLLAQFADDFSDGDLMSNPEWTGDQSKFAVDQERLRLAAPAVSSSAYLSTPSQSLYNATWEFWLHLDFNPTSGNLAKVFLTSDVADLSGPLNGYYVLIGNTPDEVSLYRQSGTSSTKIIDGEDGRLDLSTVTVRVRVTRDALGTWELYTDVGATGVDILEGTVTDQTHASSSYFGVYCLYSSTRSDKFQFDDFHVEGESFIDLVGPEVFSAEPISSSALLVGFSELLDSASAVQADHYNVSPEIGMPSSIALEADRSSVVLHFDSAFANGYEYLLTVTGVKDTTGNLMTPGGKPFLYFIPVLPAYRDIVLTELFPDPAPSVGLPETEFVEVFNRSASPFELAGWQITDGSSTAVLHSLILHPGEYLALATERFDSLAQMMVLNALPTLNNSSDLIRLVSPDGMMIDSVGYSVSWYRDQDKAGGGWTLEMIDPNDECSGSLNWKASVDSSGGTPGRINSVYLPRNDTVGPSLLSMTYLGGGVLALEFDESLQEDTPSPGYFSIEPAVQVSDASYADADRKFINLTLVEALDSTATYTITITNLRDCPGNLIVSGRDSMKLDTLAPFIARHNIVNAHELDITFSEKVDSVNGSDPANYTMVGVGSPDSLRLLSDHKTVRTTFIEPFTNGLGNTLEIKHITDRAGNRMTPDTVMFRYFVPVAPTFRDIIISEILPDPAPTIGLPEAEFIEIYNRSADPFNLSGWKITDGSTTGILSSLILLPGEYLILSSTSTRSSFSVFGEAMGLSVMPSLNNAGDNLRLISPAGIVIDSLSYSGTWYRDDEKKDGGWSLELIDVDDLCRGAGNWAASVSIGGGTPGAQNSVFDHRPDLQGPRLINVTPTDSADLFLTFDENLDAITPSNATFSIEPGVSIVGVRFGRDRTEIVLSLSMALDSAETYVLELAAVHDCPGNLIQETQVIIRLDTIAPLVQAVEVVSESEVDVTFNEKMRPESAVAVGNYSLSGSYPSKVTLRDDHRAVRLRFEDEFVNGVTLQLHIAGVNDAAGNPLFPVVLPFLYFHAIPPLEKDLVFTEIMADPSPAVRLPEVEFVEIYNRSTNPIQLLNWRLSDASTVCVLPGYIILPGAYLIICPAAKANLFAHGTTLGVSSFPSLANSGESLRLLSPDGVTIDSINFAFDWYRDDEKKDGGWTLEKIDPENLCAEAENWRAAMNDSGGTPGARNSINANMPDLTGPALESIFPVDAATLTLTFNEKLEKSVPSVESFAVEPHVPISSVAFGDPNLRTVMVGLSEVLTGGVLYNLVCSEIYDCAGNAIEAEHGNGSFALPEKAEPLDVVINEVLFNPRPTGVDFVEVYNRSGKYLDLSNWVIANVSGDSIANARSIVRTHELLPPQTYRVLTEDGNLLKGEYLQAKEETFIECKLPSLPDDEGSIAIADDRQRIIDKVLYSDSYHSALIKDDEGISLERIAFDAPSDNSNNWRSATTTSGYATPGFLNSNSRTNVALSESIIIDPEIFTPHSGLHDFTQIRFNFEKSGYIANVRILDSHGREIRRIANNELLGSQGFFRWDGDADDGSQVRIGAYMVWIEIFDPSGKVETYRKRVVVGGNFR